MTDRAQHGPQPGVGDGKLECGDLVKSFGGVIAVDGVTVAFEPGRITALIGPNGAGKTTLFHLMSGALRPDRGYVSYRGVRLDREATWRVARLGVGRLFQDVRILKRLSVLENVVLAFPEQLGENPAWSILRRAAVRRQETLLVDRARALLESVGLEGYRDDQAEALSYGQQKLLAFSRLLAAGATALLLDEPTAGVAAGLLGTIKSKMIDEARRGHTIVVIEHNMSVVMEVADWVYFLDDGQIVAFGKPEEVLADQTIRAIYLGL